ncbi:MAG TPA: zinc-binding alcohol dehydrogenase family protein [Pseudonocardiaceae bacterium]|jgi:NADPH:quinone reductase-like Zn-dependent oxidoreductase|nr:zinc-binding alcohol dehydrogenase family protein [Pseudonocardiaceae bacterium]
MHAAVIQSVDQPPQYRSVPDPVAGDGEVVVDVLAVAVHPVTRSKASGRHYSSSGRLPMIPGIDGVGRLPDGTRVYFTALDDPTGTMAERIAIPAANCVPVPDGLDDAVVAAAVNPAISSWLALRNRVELRAGESVLVLGATGNAGAIAVQLARRLGAATVIGAGRNPDALAALPGLGADAVISLDAPADTVSAEIAKLASEVDVVVDYLWGPHTELALAAIADARREPARPLRWVHIGAVAGPTITLPAAALRKIAIQLTGSGIGSIAQDTLDTETAGLLDQLTTMDLTTKPVRTPLREVEQAWNRPVATGSRLVFIP